MKKILAVILALGIPFSTVYAEHIINADVENSNIIISGTVPADAELNEVSVIIYKPGKGPQDMVSGSAAKAVEYSIQTMADEVGSFIVNAPVKGESGQYSVYVDYEGNTESGANLVSFIRIADNNAAIAALFGAAASSEAASVMSGRWEHLAISSEFYGKDTCTLPAKVLYGLKTGAPVESPSLVDAQKYFDAACAVAAASEGKIDDLTEYLKVLDLTDTAAAKYYTKGNSLMKQAVKIRLASAVTAIIGDCTKDESKWGGIKSAFDKAFDEAVVLATVEHPGGVGDVNGVIKEFAAQIGIDSPSDNSKIYYALMSKSFNSYNALLQVYKTEAAANGGSSRPGGGGSGGGGGSVVRDGNGGVSSIVADYTVIPPENIGSQVTAFIDISDMPWAIEAIADLAGKGVVSGMGDGNFKPNDAVTREQFVKMIVNAFEIKDRDKEIAFSDVNVGDWYYDVVKIAYGNGIIRGQGDIFGVGEKLTREDLAVIVYNTLNILGISRETEVKPEFIDSAEISDYAKESVDYLKNIGVLNGGGNNDFNPKNTTTRAEAAVVIYSLVNNSR